MTHPVCEGKQQPVVGQGRILDGPSHAEIASPAHQHERNVFVRVAVACPSSFVHKISVLSSSEPPPPGSGVSARRRARYATCSQYHLSIRVRFFLGRFIRVGTVRNVVVPARNVQPRHRCIAGRIVVLQGRDAGQVADEAVHHQVDLHLADSRHLCILLIDRSGTTDRTVKT